MSKKYELIPPSGSPGGGGGGNSYIFYNGGEWAQGFNYSAGQVVSYQGVYYAALGDLEPDLTDSPDVDTGNWLAIADVPGGGGGGGGGAVPFYVAVPDDQAVVGSNADPWDIELPHPIDYVIEGGDNGALVEVSFRGELKATTGNNGQYIGFFLDDDRFKIDGNRFADSGSTEFGTSASGAWCGIYGGAINSAQGYSAQSGAWGFDSGQSVHPGVPPMLCFAVIGGNHDLRVRARSGFGGSTDETRLRNCELFGRVTLL